MVRSIIGIFIGLVVAILVIAVWENFVHKLYPIPEGIDFTDKASIAYLMSNMPMESFLLILGGYVIASFVGGALATAVDKTKKFLPAMVVAGLLMLANAANLFAIPHPAWFMIASTLVYPTFTVFSAAMVLKAKKAA